jgi:hypothetical protein
MPTFSNIGLQEPSTITNRVAAVTIDRGGTAEQQEILVLGDGESSGAVARVLNTAPDSTTYGLVVRPVGASTTVQVSSLGGVVRVQQDSTVWETQIGGTVTIAPASTTFAVQAAQSGVWTVSSVSGVVSVSPVSTASVRVAQSTAADLQATVTAASTTWVTQTRLHDGLSNALESATGQPSSEARGLLVRPVFGGLTSYSASTTGQSSATTILSSAAGSRGFIYAYSITSTLAGPVEWSLYAGATRLWGGVLAAVSSAISGVNLAVTPPAYLVAGSTGAALTFNCASSNAGLNVSLAYWVST